jgi:hypothetical protein
MIDTTTTAHFGKNLGVEKMVMKVKARGKGLKWFYDEKRRKVKF